jgi:hypothetical protein
MTEIGKEEVKLSVCGSYNAIRKSIYKDCQKTRNKKCSEVAGSKVNKEKLAFLYIIDHL